MRERGLEADYLIVGAGAAAMAFADTLLSETASSMVIVDRRHEPGGHWHDAYPFVRLHSPSLNYGVNSTPLGAERLDAIGLNRGLNELASGSEICAYFGRVMRERFLPSGRVTWLPLSEVGEDGTITSLMTGARTRVETRRIVDATYAGTRVPATHPPGFHVGEGASCRPPHALVRASERWSGFVIVGAGKTAMDTVVWLLEHGVDPEAITWIRPRDAWLLARENTQPSFEFFASTYGAFAAEMEAARDASSIEDLFARLEAGDLLRRIDPAVAPTMYRCAIVSAPELAQLRRVTRVIRLGHVEEISAREIRLAGGRIPTTPRHLRLHCSADGIPRKSPQPIFQPGRIVLQYVRRCSPTFSAAFIAHIEATVAGDEQKNALCTPVSVPDDPLDWLRMELQEAPNRLVWSRSPELQQWLVGARLDRLTAMAARAMREPTTERTAILDRYRTAIKPGLARLRALVTPPG